MNFITKFIYNVLKHFGYDRRKSNKHTNVRRSTDWPEIINYD